MARGGRVGTLTNGHAFRCGERALGRRERAVVACATGARCGRRAPQQERVLLALPAPQRDTSSGASTGSTLCVPSRTTRRRVPLQLRMTAWRRSSIARRAGRRNVLTRAPIETPRADVGSTAAAKLVPFTADLRRRIHDRDRRVARRSLLARPALLGGPAYWSISPAAVHRRSPDGSVVSDRLRQTTAGTSAALRQALARSILAVPDRASRGSRTSRPFRYVTVLFLLRARDLRLMSVWHPSFLEGLLDSVERHRDRLHPGCRSWVDVPAGAVDVTGRRAPAPLLAPDPARAASCEARERTRARYLAAPLADQLLGRRARRARPRRSSRGAAKGSRCSRRD